MPDLNPEIVKVIPPAEMYFVGDAPTVLDPAVQELAHKLSAIHGRIRVTREESGVHFYMASPECLTSFGADELHKMHLAVNVDKWFSGEDRCGLCMKTGTPYRVTDLLSLTPLTQRGFPDSVPEVLNLEVNTAFLELDAHGNLVPKSPGETVPVYKLPKDHPAQFYIRERGFDPVDLYRQFKLSYCEKQRDDLFYSAGLGGFRKTPQGRIIFNIEINGISAGWQARILELDRDGIRYFLHPYNREWVPVLRFDGGKQKWVPLPDWVGWDMAKYFIGHGARRNRIVAGLDAAIAWNKASGRLHDRIGVLSEGPLDAGRVGSPGVGLLGKYMSGNQAQLLGSHFDVLIYVADSDTYGQQAKGKVAAAMATQKHVQLKFIDLPKTSSLKDLGEMKRQAARALINMRHRVWKTANDYL